MCYLSGIPFIYIDQVSGKISKTFGAAFDGLDECLDGSKAKWERALNLQDALGMATKMAKEQYIQE